MNLLRHAPGVPAGAVLGVRPEHLQYSDDGWVAVLDSTELLGAERLLHLRLGPEDLTMRIPSHDEVPALGCALRVRPLPECVHWFELATGRRQP
jgi:sn-glycerol 3-phosphate transport system ATP-binding protein